MDRTLVQNLRRRAVVLGGLAALIVPACASDRGQTVATVPAGVGTAPPPMAASADAPQDRLLGPARLPLGRRARACPSAIAKAPGNEVR